MNISGAHKPPKGLKRLQIATFLFRPEVAIGLAYLNL